MRRLWLGCFVIGGGQLVAGCTAENIRILSSTVHTVNQVSDTVSEEGVELANTACPELTSGEINKIELKGSPAVQAETKAFLGAVHNTIEYATGVNRVIRARCSDLGVDLGLPRKQLEKQEKGPYGGAEEICTDTARAFARTNARVVLHYEPPTCSTSLDAVSDCLAACGKPLTSAELSASCQGGKLVGICDGSCRGSCEGESHATCAGTCDGSCHGACDAQFHGTCSGACSGTCDGASASGTCAGTCDGVCDAGAQGTCGGQCSGDCQGTCSAEGAAKCDGKCSGDCSGKYEAVSCTGKFRPPQVDTTCHASGSKVTHSVNASFQLKAMAGGKIGP